MVTVHPGEPPIQGLAAFTEFVRGFKTAVPDMTLTVNRAHEAGNAIVVEGTFAGNNTGPMLGPSGPMPATGRSFSLDFADVFEARGELIAGHRVYTTSSRFSLSSG